MWITVVIRDAENSIALIDGPPVIRWTKTVDGVTSQHRALTKAGDFAEGDLTPSSDRIAEYPFRVLAGFQWTVNRR